MTLEEFKRTLDQPTVPEQLDTALKALWYDAKGDWDKAHEFAQKQNNSQSAWVHAYLHRKEGDTLNAQYWYTRASRTMPTQTLAQEWDTIVKTLL